MLPKVVIFSFFRAIIANLSKLGNEYSALRGEPNITDGLLTCF